MPEISVVVPIYKVEKYLRKCLNSLSVQTFREYEMFLTDDGSPDECPCICDEEALNDSRVIVIHKPNGGLSDARNAALELVSGKYITFVDSDDWLAPNALETMRDALLRTDSDLAVGNMLSVTEDGSCEEMSGNSEQERILNDREKWTTILRPCAPSKLYKAEIWKDLRFPVGRLYEDTFSYHHVLERIDRMVLTGIETYYYRLRDGSIMHTEYSIRFTDIIDAVEDRIRTLENEGMRELAERDRMFIYSQSAVAMAHLDRRDAREGKRRREIKEIYRKHYPKLMKSNAANGKEKLLFTLLRVAPHLHSRFFGRKMPLNLGD